MQMQDLGANCCSTHQSQQGAFQFKCGASLLSPRGQLGIHTHQHRMLLQLISKCLNALSNIVRSSKLFVAATWPKQRLSIALAMLVLDNARYFAYTQAIMQS